jgi:hypothetical protein
MIRLTMIATPFTRIPRSAAAASESRSTTRQSWEFGHRELRNDFGWWEIRLRLKRKAKCHSRAALKKAK